MRPASTFSIIQLSNSRAAVIFFVNQFLDSQKIPVAVGLNPFTVLTGGILGLPGVALLYGIVCWEIL